MTCSPLIEIILSIPRGNRNKSGATISLSRDIPIETQKKFY